jgi:predicted ATPase
MLEAADFAALQSAIEAARNSDAPADGVLSQLDAVEQAAKELVGDETVRSMLRIRMRKLLPVFFYFSEYSALEGRIDLDALAGEEAPGASNMQTARALLALADTDPALLGSDDYESRKAELEAVSNELTRQVFEYWTQNTDLQVSMDVDKETITRPNGQTAVARYLDIRVHDRRHGYTGNFGQRSSGFQWFFSFLAGFSQFEEYDRPVIVLLDEPALGLHARAQADFLRFINERLAGTHQVLYTTHSPFMIETGHLNRVRIVEDNGPDKGSTVTTEVFAKDRDSLFPMQAALGYDIAQSLFIGPDNLLVEGTSDFTYLTVIGEHLKSLGRTGLDNRWTVVPTGGGTNIVTFVALLGVHLDVSVLIDSSTRGSQKLTDLANRGLLDSKRLIPVGGVANAANADIEDLFTPADYLRLYNPAFAEKTKIGDLPPGDRIVKRLAGLRGGDFEHGVPADYLLRHRESLLPKFTDTTLDNFERLITRLNQTLA